MDGRVCSLHNFNSAEPYNKACFLKHGKIWFLEKNNLDIPVCGPSKDLIIYKQIYNISVV